jgi:pyruvate dehydrogenase (quinone)
VPINCSLPGPSPKMLGIRYPMEVNLIGDSKETLRALILHLI